MSVEDVSQLADQAWTLAGAGRAQEAVALFARLCELTPDDAESWMMRGALCVDLGDRASGREFLRRAVALDASYADPWVHLAKLALASGGDAAHIDEARQCAEQAVALDPDYAEAWSVQAAVQAARRQFAEAEASSRKALALDPASAQAMLALMGALRGLGRLDEAADQGQRILTLPAPAALQDEVRLQLAGLEAQRGRHGEAEAAYRAFLQRHPEHADAWAHLASLLMIMRRPEAALEACRSLQRIAPAYPGLDVNMGNACLALGDFAMAENCYLSALQRPEPPVEVYANLGMVLQSRGELNEAVAYYEKALAARPESADFHLRLAMGLQSLGRFEEAIHHCDQALQFGAPAESALAGKADILQKQGKYAESRVLLRPFIEDGKAGASARLVYAEAEAKVGDPDLAIAQLEALLAERTLSPQERQQAHATLAALCDKAGRYDQAFANFRASNALKQGRFDPARHEAYIGRLIASWTPERLAALAQAGSDSDLPVFIVGMPRSGTSLVEQILASHPAVYGAGELEDILKITHALSARYQPVRYPECLGLAGFDVLRELAAGYLGRLRDFSAEARRITDKMPHNFLHLGLIQVLFPRARVIHIRRDPLDTCLSCHFQEFSASHSYAYDLAQLGAYYRQYERIMAHWEKVLGLPMLNVRYEELVEQQEAVSRQMIEFCGLAWDDRVLCFHETKRDVATPSFDQVRQPMYRKSMQRWRHYEAHLQPLIAALGDAI